MNGEWLGFLTMLVRLRVCVLSAVSGVLLGSCWTAPSSPSAGLSGKRHPNGGKGQLQGGFAISACGLSLVAIVKEASC